MTKIIEIIKEKAVPILKEAGVTRSALFGSVVRGEDTKDSDVDILIQPPDRMSLFDFIGLGYKLEDALHRKVDLVSYRAIHPVLKEQILSEQLPIL